jgi:transcriptional regulator
MARKSSDPDHTDLQGTLDLLILRTLLFGPVHGQGVASSIERNSGDALRIDHGSLYPALQRLQARRWISAKWGVTENNRRAKYYSLTAAGKNRLAVEVGKWDRLSDAVNRILRLAEDKV